MENNNMEETQTFQAPAGQDQPTIPPRHQQVPAVSPLIKRPFDKRYLFILLIIIGIAGGFFTAGRQPIQTPGPTPSDTPTPTPKSKPVIPMATQSAYIELTRKVASLSGAIQNIQVSDTTLSPPTIELPLGFPNQ